MNAIISFVKEPYATQLQKLGKIVLTEKKQSAELAAQNAIEILNCLIRNTLCDNEIQMLLRLIGSFYGAAHPNHQIFECNRLRNQLGIS